MNNIYKFSVPIGTVEIKQSCIADGEAVIRVPVIYYRINRDVQWEVIYYDKDNVKWNYQVAKESGYETYALGEREIEQFKIEIKKQEVVEQERKKVYLSINKPLYNANYVDFPKELAFRVVMREYCITSSKSRMPILGTTALGPCVALALYDKKRKIAALAHLGWREEFESVEKLIKSFDIQSTVAHLHGGSPNTYCKCLNLIEFIIKIGIQIENCALIEYSNGCTSLAIDARNGRLYTLVKHTDLTYRDSRAIGLLVVASADVKGCMPINKGYDGLIDLVDGLLVNEPEKTVNIPEAKPIPSELLSFGLETSSRFDLNPNEQKEYLAHLEKYKLAYDPSFNGYQSLSELANFISKKTVPEDNPLADAGKDHSRPCDLKLSMSLKYNLCILLLIACLLRFC